MAFFGRRKSAWQAADWTPVAIHIIEAERPYVDGDSPQLSYTKYSFALEVRKPGAEPYRVEHVEKVSRKITAPGFSRDEKIPNGMDVSGWVRIDDPMKVTIDWTSYKSTPESAAAFADASQVEYDLAYARTVVAKAKPAMQEQLRSSSWLAVSSLAKVVADGQLSRDEWEQMAQSDLRKTLITAEQYAEAAAIADGAH